MNTKAPKSSAALTPLPESAATITRCSGVGASPSTSGPRIRIHTVPGPGSRNAPATKRYSIAVKYPTSTSVGKKGTCRPASGPGIGASGRPESPGSSSSVVRSRHAEARMISVASSARASVASSSSTLRPGRATRAVATSGAIGTGRRISTVTRVSSAPSRGSHRSSARARSAEGGPACWLPGSHGPRVCSVATSRSPSGRKNAPPVSGGERYSPGPQAETGSRPGTAARSS